MSTDAHDSTPDLLKEDWERWYLAMSRLGKHRRLGAAEKWIYGWLLLQSGVRAVQRFTFYWPDLVLFVSRREQSVRETLARLQQKDLVIVRGITMAGRATVDVALPWREIESRAVDPQLTFGFMGESRVESGGLRVECKVQAPKTGARKTVPENRSGKPYGFSGRKTVLPISEDFLDRVGRSELSMGEAFRSIAPVEARRPEKLPGSDRHGSCDIDIKRLRRSDIDICQEQKRWEEQIQGALGDPRLQEVVARKVAAALVAGRIKWETVEKVCRAARRVQRETKGTDPAWAYFAGTMPKVFSEAGLPWKQAALAETLDT